jgi:AbrB family looped-hinge helix DNA binding protein
MVIVKVSSKGQIVIPKALRESRHIKTGAVFVITTVGDELRLTPAPVFEKTSIKNAAGILHRSGRKYLSEEKTKQAIRQVIETLDNVTKAR